MAKITGHCPSQLMSSLATDLNMVTQDEVGKGVQEKHNMTMGKIQFGSSSINRQECSGRGLKNPRGRSWKFNDFHLNFLLADNQIFMIFSLIL